MQKLGPNTQSTLLDSTLDAELTTADGEPLIPGLPDDVALQCILRVPVDKHASCKTVCKRWHALFGGSKSRFFMKRKEFGFRDPWLFVAVHDAFMTEIKWKVLDLTHLSWHTIPTMPHNDIIFPCAFSCASIPREGVLFVCGGCDSRNRSQLNSVFRYEIMKDQWTVMNNMITERMFFASEVIDGMMNVAGGVGTKNTALNSAEVFDPETGSWQRVSDMLVDMLAYYSVVLDGKLYATESLLCQSVDVPKGQVYDPAMNTWENMPLGLRKGWTGQGIVVHGHLFVVTTDKRTSLEVYDFETDSWDVVEGSATPKMISQPCRVSCLESKIFIVCKGLHVVVGYITRRKPSESLEKRRCRFSVEWEMVDAPDCFSILIPHTAHVLLA